VDGPRTYRYRHVCSPHGGTPCCRMVTTFILPQVEKRLGGPPLPYRNLPRNGCHGGRSSSSPPRQLRELSLPPRRYNCNDFPLDTTLRNTPPPDPSRPRIDTWPRPPLRNWGGTNPRMGHRSGGG